MLGAFCSKPEYFDILKRIGTDIIELSGNHNADYGYQAYVQSLRLYRANGISIVGGGE
ncbi:MAG UNVERIFIED_CONTAM: CapA family protein [Anaerolineae bacterium]|jgi:poly-gamma-glutamate synthesis protein (capsule biosynthesis protein)